VHLTGEADAGYFFGAQTGARDGFADGDACSAPPVFRLLLSPSDLRRSERLMLFRGGGDDAALAVDDEGARSSSTNINPQCVDKASSTESAVRPKP
jgi:hypothetical protein